MLINKYTSNAYKNTQEIYGGVPLAFGSCRCSQSFQQGTTLHSVQSIHRKHNNNNINKHANNHTNKKKKTFKEPTQQTSFKPVSQKWSMFNSQKSYGKGFMVSYQGMGWSRFKFEDKSNSSGSLFVVLHLGLLFLFLKLLILCLELLLLSVGHIFLSLIFFDLQLQHFRDLVINTKDLVYVQSERKDRKSGKERE